MMTVDKNKHIPNPAFALEQEIIREEVQEGLQVAVEKLDEKTEEKQKADHFHNTKHLLQQYRRVAYAVKMSEADLNVRIEMEHGTCLFTFEQNAELAGIDLSNTKLENYARTVMRSKQMMEIINHALEYVKEDPDRGDLLHAVLEQTYFTTRKPRNREEILYALSRLGFDMSMASYHIYLKQAIRAIDRILWGYTARDCMDIIKQFLPEQ